MAFRTADVEWQGDARSLLLLAMIHRIALLADHL